MSRQIDISNPNRRSDYARNQTLEDLLGSLNYNLSVAEQRAMAPFMDRQPEVPPIFLVGAPRCGSTLFMQWLSATGVFAYPTNILSRFWAAPIVGAKIQKLLTDPEYDFRNELYDLKGDLSFSSSHGKTEGALSPNEFWYFWRRFFPEDDYQPSEFLKDYIDEKTLRAEFAGLIEFLGKPFAAKGMIFNENIPLMAKIFPNALFIWLKRKPEYNIQSLLLTRKRQYGDMQQWYSFRIREYSKLKDLSPVESVSGQVASLHKSIKVGLSELPEKNKVIVNYENFCEDPKSVYESLAYQFAQQGIELPNYAGPSYFEPQNKWRLDWITSKEVKNLYQLYYN